MRFVLSTLVVTFSLSGCALSVGAGASGRLGDPSGASAAECDSFESCDIAYRDALVSAERCRREGDADDCEAEDRAAAASYEALHETTARELEALRTEAQEREAALTEAEQAADAAHLEAQDDCAHKGHPTEPPPAVRRGNGWFESDSGVH
jgi:hypothetical protein